MSPPFEYSYNPQWSTYHSQASANASHVHHHQYMYEHAPQQQMAHQAESPSSLGLCRRHTNTPYNRDHTTSATRAPRGSSKTDLFPSGGTRSFARPQPAINAQWVLQNPGRSWDASVPPPLQLEYLPRRPENSGYTSEQSVHFASHGLPGPYIRDILSKNSGLDDPKATVFAHLGWKRLQWTFDFPGLSPATQRIPVMDGDRHLTRLEIAMEICLEIVRITRSTKGQMPGVDPRWRLDKCNPKYLRLVALVFYASSWIPVLAVDP
ncbi:hypothetical protein C8J55DRAFT_567262 [Lentinula edodes]|uniref:Uncharacterized protein n=1 Tax=Lentinula lateritia TaxID=40482 RepID=A0A9W9DCS7_9AGAR|nr:hypothetical protein C8J55DRAFT_567262 [Lentinula edodes]